MVLEHHLKGLALFPSTSGSTRDMRTLSEFLPYVLQQAQLSINDGVIAYTVISHGTDTVLVVPSFAGSPQQLFCPSTCLAKEISLTPTPAPLQRGGPERHQQARSDLCAGVVAAYSLQLKVTVSWFCKRSCHNMVHGTSKPWLS